MGYFKKGNVPWNKGLTKETNETVKYLADLARGDKKSDDHKHKTSIAMTGRKLSDDHKRKISIAHKPHKHSKSTKRKISIALLKAFVEGRLPTVFKKGHVPWIKGRKQTDDHRRKISKSMQKAYREGRVPTAFKRWPKPPSIKEGRVLAGFKRLIDKISVHFRL